MKLYEEEQFKFDLQMFNDGAADDGAEDKSEDTPPEDIADEDKAEDKDTFTQDDVDGIIAKRLAREKLKFEKEFNTKLAKEKLEAERLAKLTGDERKEEELRIAREEFELERSTFQQEKLELQITKELAEKGLPVKFAPLLVAQDAEESLANIKSFEKDWQEALEKAVTEKLKGTSPGSGTSTNVAGGGFGKRLADQRKESESATAKDNPYF